MDSGLAQFIQLNYFPTGRRLHTLRQVLELAQKEGLSSLQTLVVSAIDADKATWALEGRWAVLRRRGKLSQKQLKEQKALQQLDGQVDRALAGLRDGALALIRGAGPDEQDLVVKVEGFLDALLPNGLHAVTSLPYSMELTAVVEIVGKLQGELAPVVAELGLTVQAARVAKLCDSYAAAQKAVDTLDFGAVRAAREQGQLRLLEVVAVILGTFHEPAGAHAKKRAALLLPIVRENAAISEHIRARRAVPEVDPETGEEQPGEVPGQPEATDEPGGSGGAPPGGAPPA